MTEPTLGPTDRWAPPDHMQPTVHLRWLWANEKATLQQWWYTPSLGAGEWRKVPVVNAQDVDVPPGL